MKIGVLTGGGDCPGLNSVIYGILLSAFDAGHEIIGIEKGWRGFLENKTRELNIAEFDDLHKIGGTLIYTSRTNPYKVVKDIKDPEKRKKVIKETVNEMIKQFDILGIDALITIGGDDTLGVAAAMYEHRKANVVGVPKTIDNDLSSTDYTFGFWSAVQLASNAIDNLTTTARSHQRVFVVEIMGRDAGWLTLASGISTGADIILIPEKPFDLKKDVISVLKERNKKGYKYHIIACSEGAVPTEASLNRDFKTISKELIKNLPKDNFGNPILAKLNLSKIIVKELEQNQDLKMFFETNEAEFEIRNVVLGHTMRAGTPNSFDRLLGLRMGIHAIELINKGDFGKMTSLDGESIKGVPLIQATNRKKLVPLQSDFFKLAELMTRIIHQSK
ncbi:MAG: 6-phosphofructokinase [Candidatus Hodarchaeales archaeon]|jgi:6-phosphofructokinase 1